MTAQLVTVILDRFDGAENAYVKGTATFTPSLEFPDTADQMLIGQAPVTATFRAGSLPQVIVIANDTAGPQGDSSPGWTWNVTYSGVPGDPAPASYYILSTNGDTQRLSSLASVPAAQPGRQYVPLPDAPPADDTQVLGLSSASPLVTEWVDQSGGGGGGSGTVTTVSVATANGFAGTVANPTTTPAITVKTTVTGLLKGNGTAVSAASAGTDYVAPTGSGAALTGITAAQVGAASTGALATEVSRAEAAEALLAPLASPALTGTPTAPTATALTDDTQVATTAYADAAVAVETSRAETAEALKLAKASNLSDLANAATARTNLGLGTAATQASSAFDAAGAATTAQTNAESFATSAVGTETTRAETAEALLAPLASPALTGNPTAPTQSAGNNSTRLATTAYADAAVGVETSRATTAEAGKVAKAGDTMTGHLAPAVVTLTDASTVTVNAASGNDFRLLTTSGIGTTRAIGAPSNPVDGQALSLDIQQDTSGSRVVTWTSGAAGYSFGTDGSPTLSTAANAVDTVGFRYHGGLGKWICQGWKLGFS